MPTQVETEPTISEPPPRKNPQLVERAGMAMFWNGISVPLKLIAQAAASIILFRVLNAKDISIYGKVSALATLLGALSDFGIERAIPRFVPEVETRLGRSGLSRFLYQIGVIRAAVLVPFLLAILLFPDFFWSLLKLDTDDLKFLPDAATRLQPIILGSVAALMILGAFYDTSIQVLLTYFRQKTTNLLDILNSLLFPALRSALVLAMGVIGAIYGLVLGTLIFAVVAFGLMIRALRQEAPPARKRAGVVLPDPRSFWRRFTSMSILMQVVSFSALLYDQPIVVTMMTLLINDQARQESMVALAVLCFTFVRRLLGTLVMPMSGVQTPLFSRLYAENRLDGLRTAYTSLTKILILILLPCGVGIIIMSRNILMLLFGQARVGQVLTLQTLPDVLIASSIMIAGLFTEAIISVAMNVLLVFEKTRVVFLARLATLISIPLYLLLIPPFGIIGAAVAVTITALASRVVALIYAQRALELGFPTRFLSRVAGATLAFAIVLAPLAFALPAQPTSVAPIESIELALANGVLILLAAVIFLFTFRKLGGIDDADKKRFQGMRIPGIKLALRYL